MAKIKDKATTKEARIHNGGKRVSSINGVGKTGQLEKAQAEQRRHRTAKKKNLKKTFSDLRKNKSEGSYFLISKIITKLQNQSSVVLA